MLVQALIFPVAVRLAGHRATIIFGAALMGVSLACLPLTRNFTLHFAILTLFSTGSSLWEPGVPVLIGTYASAWHLGAAMGVNFFFCRIGAILSPLIGGYFWDHCGTCSFYIG